MKKILCIDDYRPGLEARQAVLKLEGYEVAITTNPEHALKQVLDGQAVDLIIVDYTMPEMSGGTFVRELRKVKSDVPIIMYSSASPAEFIDYDIFIDKTSNPRELLYHVKKILSGDGYGRRAQGKSTNSTD